MKEPNTKGKRVMTVKEVSESLRIPRSTVYHLAQTGKIRAAKYGKHWRFFEEDVLSYHYARQNFLRVQGNLTERRTHPRINAEIPATLAVLLSEKKGFERKGMICNLSQGGLLFAWEMLIDEKDQLGDVSVAVGDPVKVRFEIPGQSVHRLELEARIVYTTTNSKKAVGMKFRNISSVDEGVIRNYVG